MISGNPSPNRVTETKVISGLKIIETDVQIDRPIFKDVIVEKPKYVEKPIEVPTELQEFCIKAGEMIADTAMKHILVALDEKLSKAIDKRIKEIEVPKIIEKEQVSIKTIEVEKEIIKPIIKTVEVIHANIQEVTIEKPIYKEVEVLKPIIKDVIVKNAVIENVAVRNAIVENVPVVNAIIKQRTVETVHPKWLKPKELVPDEHPNG